MCKWTKCKHVYEQVEWDKYVNVQVDKCKHVCAGRLGKMDKYVIVQVD